MSSMTDSIIEGEHLLPSKQKVVLVDDFAGDKYLEHVQVVEQEVPQPGEEEVLVQFYLRPINPSDFLSIKEGYKGTLPRPLVPGIEGVGRIVKLGPGAGAFRFGQRVIATEWYTISRGRGTWEQYLNVPERDLVPVPDGVDDATAAQTYVNPPTAFGLLKSIGASPGEYVLQTAATSTVGKQIIALAKHWGLKTINVVRREDAVQELKALGADEVLVMGKNNIVERTMAITGGKGAHGAADAVGGAIANDVVDALRRYGTSYLYGVLAPESAMKIDQGSILWGEKGIHGWLYASWLATQDKKAVYKELFDLMKQKVLPVGEVAQKFPLDQVKEALKAAESTSGGRKVFLEG